MSPSATVLLSDCSCLGQASDYVTTSSRVGMLMLVHIDALLFHCKLFISYFYYVFLFHIRIRATLFYFLMVGIIYEFSLVC